MPTEAVANNQSSATTERDNPNATADDRQNAVAGHRFGLGPERPDRHGNGFFAASASSALACVLS